MNLSLILFIIGFIFVIIGYVNQLSSDNIDTSNSPKYIEMDLYKKFINDSVLYEK